MLELICSVAWSIWDHRNSVVWNHGNRIPKLVVNEASSMVFQWQKPLQGWLTCNIDAAINSHKFSSSFGCVLRNDAGLFIAAYGGKLEGIADPKIAEAMTFGEALSWLKNKNLSQVYIEVRELSSNRLTFDKS